MAAAIRRPRRSPRRPRRPREPIPSCAGSTGFCRADPHALIAMHPALSVILFTTASGAGYGLLFLIGLLTGTPLLPASRWFALAAFALSLGAISFGLMASTFHLGRPERAWRAISQ